MVQQFSCNCGEPELWKPLYLTNRDLLLRFLGFEGRALQPAAMGQGK